MRKCWNLKEFSVSSDELRDLELDETGIEILHSSVARSSNSKSIGLRGLRLVNLPDQLSCLTSLNALRLYDCEIIDDLKLHIFFDGMLSLREVTLKRCGNIIDLPSNTKHLLGLRSLDVMGCRRLRSLPELPPSIATLIADDCKSLEIVSTWRSSGDQMYFRFNNCVQLIEQSLHNIMEAAAYSIPYCLLHKYKYMGDCSIHKYNSIHRYTICVTGSKVPEWIKYRAAQSSVTIELPQISDLTSFFFCIVVDVHSEINGGSQAFGCTCYLEGFKAADSTHGTVLPDMKSDDVFIWTDDSASQMIVDEIRSRNQQSFANVKLRFEFSAYNHAMIPSKRETSKLMIKECGVWPVSVSECQKFVEQMEIER
ncbi:disease resistance protein RML1A-like [Neltuma alba]|uniref:disease resistance protein RML1A-like n=1 Tax=Neltuma alba TaxID=207710 RepID=UPI0010A36008|nr:disease resistance protein RML1A-like [Prosopis alba]